jgi:hypothetical protein
MHTLTSNDAATLTLNDRQHLPDSGPNRSIPASIEPPALLQLGPPPSQPHKAAGKPC